MYLNELMEHLEIYLPAGNEHILVTDLVYDSRKVSKDSVFVCIAGTVADGHDYIPDAIEKGAVALVVERI